MTNQTDPPLIPGNGGENCPGNGEHRDKNGEWIDCCCDECDYFLDCFPQYDIEL